MATISGTVITSDGNKRRLIRVYLRSSGALVSEGYSDPSTGAYSISGLSAVEHFVVELDE